MDKCLVDLERICAGWAFPHVGPTRILNFLYLGGVQDAKNIDKLRQLGITHVLDCASSYSGTGEAFYAPHGIKYRLLIYDGFPAEDDYGYDM
jgi:hypothetical protein